MANPWEQNWTDSAAQPVSASAAPWEHDWSASAPKSIVEKLAETWPARLAKGIYKGVTLPGDVYSGEVAVDPNNPEFMSRVMDLTSVASPMSPKVGSSIGAPVAAKPPTTEALFQASNKLYDEARNSPFSIDAGAVGNLARSIQEDLARKGILKEFAPDTHGVLSHIQTAEPGAVATGGNLISIREALREASRNYSNPREANAANQAIAALDSFIAKPPPESVLAGDVAAFAKTAADARGNYAAGSRSETVQNELETARRNAAVANSGRNLDNAQRQRFNAITKSDAKSAGFNDAELAQMDNVIFGTPTGNAMRTAGNLLGGGGGLGAAIVGGVGATFNPWLAATPLAGALLKKGGDLSTYRQINKLDEMVRSRSPLAQEYSTVSTGLSPQEQAYQTALVRSLMMSPTLPAQQPDQGELISQMLMRR